MNFWSAGRCDLGDLGGEILGLSAHGDIPITVHSMRRGAKDFRSPFPKGQ